MRLVYEKKSDEFWRNEIAANSGNTKRLWRTMQGLLGEKSATEIGVILQTILLFFIARRYAGAVSAVIVCLSVCLSVCYKSELYKHGETQDHTKNGVR